jgi:ER-bound oxygenase mpaB/B'/Rubber oxygenase, catalytic domain
MSTVPRVSVPLRYRDPFTPEPWARNVARLAPKIVRDEPQLHSFAVAHMEGDPLADELVTWMLADRSGQARASFELALTGGLAGVSEPAAPLAAFFEQVERVPAWLDRACIERASALFHRAYWGSERVLFSTGLLAGYVSGAVSKVLTATGALERMAQRRAAETQKFICDVYGPGSMARFSDGFITTIRVRVMHAMVRRQLIARGFDVGSWGVPINQADMAATALQFSITFVLGLRGLGFHVSAEEADAVLHLWRYTGMLMGVRSDFLPSTEAEARRQLRLSVASQAGPDDDSRALARALISIDLRPGGDAAARRLAKLDMRYREALARLALGRDAADALGLPNTIWTCIVPLLIPLVFAAECLRRLVPGGNRIALKLGRRRARNSLAAQLGSKLPSYQPHTVPEPKSAEARLGRDA